MFMQRVKVTIVDIAKEAGVSPATVDRVLNERDGVRRVTVEKVLSVAQRLNYPLPAQLIARPGLIHLSFDFLLPSGPNTFMQSIGRISESTEHSDGIFSARGRLHQIESFNPGALSRALLKIGENTNGVAFVALEHPLVREAVNTLVDRGIPVATFVSDLSHSRRMGYIGVDNRAAGRTAGHLMGRFIGPKSGKVAVIAGSLSYRGHEEREAGFRQILGEEFPSLRIVGLAEGRDDYSRNYVEMKKILHDHPDLLGIYNIGAGSQGVAEALIEMRRADSVCFIGHELTEFTRQYLIDGVVDAVINQDPRNEVLGAMRLLTNCHAKRDPMAGVETVRIEVFVRENMP
ncbi:MAG TPA: LacI family DNA-binding transcriptional regulator [Magnetospirillaceae bacterium]|jgi:LacI family transcriptional regulator